MSLSAGYKEHVWKWWREDECGETEEDARELLAPGAGGEVEVRPEPGFYGHVAKAAE